MLQLTLFEPASNWTPPDSFPNLSGIRRLALDTEGSDPDIKIGGGVHRKNGFLSGISLATEDRSWYFPFAHLGGGNLDRSVVFPWLAELFREEREWIFHNAQHDLSWLRFHGFRPKGIFRCTQLIEALLDEEREDGYSLDVVAREYLGVGKDEGGLREAAKSFGVDPKADMWKLPAKFVGPYAEGDARKTYDIFLRQEQRIKKEELEVPYELECALIPMVNDMYFRGIRVDLERAQQINEQWKKDIQKLRDELGTVDIWSGDSIAKECDRRGIQYPKTEKGNPSFNKTVLENSDEPFFKQIHTLRGLDRIRGTYLEQNLLLNSINGRIHPQFLQVHSDEGGTRSLRFACKNPNAQQFPKRSKIQCNPETFSLFDLGPNPVGIGKTLRGCLVPEEGRNWLKYDFDSQEPRMQVHYALMMGYPGAKEAAEVFAQGRKLYHFIEESTDLTYAESKDTWLGRSYGMGVKKFAKTNGLDRDEAERVLDELDKACPFIKRLQKAIEAKIERAGYIRNIIGAKQRFDHWVPAIDNEDIPPVKGYDKARAKWPNARLQRAFVYKGLNRLIQSSCAHQAKKGYLEAYRAGYLCVLPLHDEGNWADIQNKKQAEEIGKIMEDAIPLQLPSRCDMDFVERWL